MNTSALTSILSLGTAPTGTSGCKNDACGATAQRQQPSSPDLKSLTLRLHHPIRVEVLEHKHILLRLVTHIVESLIRVVLQIHRGAHVVAADVVCFDEVGRGDGAAVADGEGPVLYSGD